MRDIGSVIKNSKLAAEIERLGELPSPSAPACSTCNDLGVVSVNAPVGHELFGRLFPCPEPGCEAGNKTRAVVWENKYKAARVPPLYQDMTFTSWDSLSDLDKVGKWPGWAAARLFLDRPDHYITAYEIYEFVGLTAPPRSDKRKNSLMFHGPVGLGKTGMMAAIINGLFDLGRPVLYFRARDMISEVQARYSATTYPQAKDVKAEMIAAPYLAIDEFNVQNETPDRLEIIEDIIRGRMANRRPTLMTSNLDQTAFYAAWGERTADVTIAMAHWIEFAGPKLRDSSPTIREP